MNKGAFFQDFYQNGNGTVQYSIVRYQPYWRSKWSILNRYETTKKFKMNNIWKYTVLYFALFWSRLLAQRPFFYKYYAMNISLIAKNKNWRIMIPYVRCISNLFILCPNQNYRTVFFKVLKTSIKRTLFFNFYDGFCTTFGAPFNYAILGNL